MQQNSFFLGVNRDITDARTASGWSLCPVLDIDTTRYGVNVHVDDTFSFLYSDLYLRQVKEALRHTMLVHESVFESQICELHRLYRKQKELMMEMEETRHNKALYLNSGLPIPRTHWMSSSISAYQTRNLPHEEENISRLLVDNKVEKFEKKKVLDLELPVFEYSDMLEEVHEAQNFLEEQSLQRMSLDSGKQSSKLQLDLNEPAKIEEHSDYVFNQFLSSVSLHGKHGLDQPQGVVQELPCLTSTLLLDKRYKSLMTRSRSRNKVKHCPSNKTFKGSDHDPHSSGQASSESQSNQTSMEKGSSSSLSEAKSAKKGTSLGNKRHCKPQMKSSKGQKVVAKRSGRVKRKRSRRISLVAEGNYQQVSAAEAIVDISRKSGRETAACITSLSKNLLWFADISSSVAEDNKIDTLQLTEKKLEEHETNLRLNSSDNIAAVSSIVLKKQRRSRARQGKRKCQDDQHIVDTFSEWEANDDLQVIGKLMEASDLKWNCWFPKNKSKSSPPKPVDAFTSSGEEKTGVDWGALRKRRRGSRIPAADFKHMIINQVV